MAEKKNEGTGCGCLDFAIGVIVLVLIGVGLNSCSSCSRNNDDSSSQSSSSKVEKKKPTKKQKEKAREKERKIKDSQSSMSSDLSQNSALSQFISKIKYDGDGEAEIKVAASFLTLSNNEKNAVAQKVNNVVTSDAEDTDTVEEDPYSFLTFTYQGNLVGRSKYFSHNEYKWK